METAVTPEPTTERPSKNRTPWIIAAVLAAIAIVAVTLLATRQDDNPQLFPRSTPAQFRVSAEQTIIGDVEANIDGGATVECDAPDATEVGTLFDCTATAGDKTTYTYEAEITGYKEVTVTYLDETNP